VDPGEVCGEPTLPACENGLLCVQCACRQLGDCQNNGNGVDLFDIIEKIDIVLQRRQPTDAQMILCDDDCNAKIDLFDVLNEIDVVLGTKSAPLVCAP
jgi:hypothetical protein